MKNLEEIKDEVEETKTALENLEKLRKSIIKLLHRGEITSGEYKKMMNDAGFDEK